MPDNSPMLGGQSKLTGREPFTREDVEAYRAQHVEAWPGYMEIEGGITRHLVWQRVAKIIMVPDAFMRDSIFNTRAQLESYLLEANEPKEKVWECHGTIQRLPPDLISICAKLMRYGLMYRVLVDPTDLPPGINWGDLTAGAE